MSDIETTPKERSVPLPPPGVEKPSKSAQKKSRRKAREQWQNLPLWRKVVATILWPFSYVRKHLFGKGKGASLSGGDVKQGLVGKAISKLASLAIVIGSVSLMILKHVILGPFILSWVYGCFVVVGFFQILDNIRDWILGFGFWAKPEDEPSA